jgi:hypothetical protein
LKANNLNYESDLIVMPEKPLFSVKLLSLGYQIAVIASKKAFNLSIGESGTLIEDPRQKCLGSSLPDCHDLEVGFNNFEIVWQRDNATVWNTAVYVITT